MEALTDREREILRQLRSSNLVPRLFEELERDTHTAWQRANDTAEREAHWHLTRAIAKLRNKFDIIFYQVEKP